MGEKTLAAMKEAGAVYLHAIGGAAQVYARATEKVLGVYLLEFGIPEAMWHLKVKNFLAIVTMDAHVLVTVQAEASLDLLRPVYEYCARRGYRPEGEAIRVGSWPVQFVPPFDALTREAMRQAETVDLDGTPLRVVRADYLAAIALGAGRAKDHARIVALLDADAVTAERLRDLAGQYGLHAEWDRFRRRFLEP
jgi:hypothetical protein